MSSRLPHHTPAHLRTAVMRLARVLRQQATGEMTPSLLSALTTIEREGPVTAGRLAALERVQPPSMTKIIARLDELGYVERRPNPNDRRVTWLEVSDEGRKFVDSYRERRDAYLARRLEDLSDDERLAIERALPLLDRLAADEGEGGR